MRIILFALLLACNLPVTLSAQTLEDYRHWQIKKLPVKDTMRVDILSLLPNSLYIEGVSDTTYFVLPAQALIIWKQKPLQDSVLVKYRRLHVSLAQPYRHKPDSLIRPLRMIGYDKPAPIYQNQSYGLLQSENVNYSGSYARNFSLGSNQDVVLNSNFNFLISGYLLDSIKVEAAITDNTIPFQPQGNTQRIQEFDQIYIRLSKNKHLLQVGDYNLEKPKGYFINYFKRVQGLFYENEFGTSSLSNKMGVSASVAKGAFARNVFSGTEGNQGPYRLSGNNGEQYFIVLAGTEKVYLDNMLLQRGENADYIIDYNTAEILFMPRRLITKDSRIQVEFEYQNRSYVNSLFYGYDELQWGKKLNLRINAYANQDAKNQSYVQDLSGAQKQFLSSIGDSIQYAFYPSLVADTFSSYKILYRISDTLVNGVLYDSVFTYSTQATDQLYALSFSQVGAGKGNYQLQSSNANGRVYEWVAPINNIPQGSFEPVQLLITPKKHHLISALAAYEIDSFKKVNVEFSGSNYDPNLFSAKDKNSHVGTAWLAQYNETRFFGKPDSTQSQNWIWQNSLHYEQVAENYKAIAPYRNVEFFRDWNVTLPNEKRNEQLLFAETQMKHKWGAGVRYQYGKFKREELYTGDKHIATWSINRELTKLSLTYNKLSAKDTINSISFFRPVAELKQNLPILKKMEVGGRYAIEDSRVINLQTDTLNPQSFRFTTQAIWLSNGATSSAKWTIKYHTRADELPSNNSFKTQSHSRNFEGNFFSDQWKEQSLSLTGSYRQLFIDDTTFSNAKPQQSMVGRIEYSASLLKRLVRLRTLYEIGNGQEQKRSFTYVEVAAGQGQYYWVDYNKDSVQQANEFEEARYADQKKFIRLVVPTNDFVKANFINFNQNLTIEPTEVIATSTQNWWLKSIRLFSAQLNAQVSNRVLANEGMRIFIPFNPIRNDSNIIAASTLISQNVFFNRLNSRWGIDYNYNFARNKFLLTYGIEGYRQGQHLIKARYTLPASLTLHLQWSDGYRQFTSPLNDNRSYLVNQHSFSPSLTWIAKSILRITTAYSYQQKRNDASLGDERANIHSGSCDIRFTQPLVGVVQAKATFTQIAYNGEVNESVAYQMLESLQPGKNLLWNLSWERRIGKGIEISVDYEGRKMETLRVIHTGRMSLRAIL